MDGGSYPLGELRVHHEVVDVLLRLGELQLSGHHGHHEGSAARTLWGTEWGVITRQAAGRRLRGSRSPWVLGVSGRSGPGGHPHGGPARLLA